MLTNELDMSSFRNYRKDFAQLGIGLSVNTIATLLIGHHLGSYNLGQNCWDSSIFFLTFAR